MNQKLFQRALIGSLTRFITTKQVSLLGALDGGVDLGGAQEKFLGNLSIWWALGREFE
jgi:hypothetical protein